ncbi:carbohydrate ABC transporter permease [Paenibacillus yanchengensis]|uniref:Carbohydrate ABC transporter permease n=1 Tax=Paenibacillus yanchengensis TaxID=2035833 RepID=A0ABW4YQY2_9BACL
MKLGNTGSIDRTIITDMDFKKKRVKVGYYTLFLFMILVVATTIYPIIWLVLGSFKSLTEFYSFPPTFFPQEWVWKNYSNAWNSFHFSRYILNTMTILAGNLIAAIIPSALCGYSLAKLRPRGQKTMFYVILAAVMIPSQLYMVPLYLNLRELPLLHWNLFDSYWAFWLPSMANPFFIYIFYSFFISIPDDLLEAARIDGAREFPIFIRIVVPICQPVFVVAAIFTMTGTWNEFFWPMLVLTDMDKFPIMTAVNTMLRTTNASGGGADYNSIFSGLVIGLVPAVILFFIFQKQILRGYTMSGIKG